MDPLEVDVAEAGDGLLGAPAPVPAEAEAASAAPHGAEDEAEGSGEEGSDEEFDKRQYGIYQCLPVDDAEPDWEAGEAETVEEYLRRVRYEARQLPEVVTSSTDAQKFDDLRTDYSAAVSMPECRPELKPSPAWVQHFLQQFAKLRRQLQREYELLTGQVAGTNLHIAYQHPAAAAASQQELVPLSLASPSALMPELQPSCGMDQVQVANKLHGNIRRVLRGDGLSPEDAALLYALSARIEKPLHADTCALYRSLLRHCARLRAGAAGPHDPLLPHLNILISIAGAYFGQDEELVALWEE